MVINVDRGPALSRFMAGRKRIRSGGREKRWWRGGAHGLIKQGELIFLQRFGHISRPPPAPLPPIKALLLGAPLTRLPSASSGMRLEGLKRREPLTSECAAWGLAGTRQTAEGFDIGVSCHFPLLYAGK